MADNTELASGSGGDTLRTLEDGSNIKWPVGVSAYATTVGSPDVLTIPTAAALADDTSTPTTLLQGSCLMVYDGATWDMGRGDSTNGLLVNLGSNNDVSLTGDLPDTAAGDLAAIKTAVQVIDNAISGNEILIAGGATQTNDVKVTLDSEVVTVDLGANNDVTLATLPDTATGDLAAMVVDLAAIEVLLGTIDADTGAIKTAVELIDNAIDGTEMQVDVVASLPAGDNNIGNVDIASSVALDVSAATVTVDNGGTFATQATLQAADNVAGRFKLTDGTEVANVNASNQLEVEVKNASLTVDATGSGDVPITLDGESVAVTGTFWQATQPVSGTITANLSATDNAVLDNIDTNTDYGQVVGGGTEASALRVTLANDSTGVVSIDDGGGSITVDGTVTANLSATDNTVLDNIDTNTTGLAGCVDGTELQIDIVGSLPAGSAAIGKLAANDGVDIGDVDVTSIAAGTNTIGGVIAAHQTDSAYDGTTSCTIKRATGLAASGTVAMVAAVAAKKIRVLAIALFATSATATNVYIANDDNDIIGDASNPIPLATDADGDNTAGFVMPWNPGGWFETDTANEALNVILSAAQDVIYAVTYIEVD